MRRREFLSGLCSAAAWPACREGLAQGRHARVGLIASVAPTSAMLTALRQGLRERGYIEGQNLSISVHWPKESFAQNPGIAAEVARSNVDVIIAWTTPAVMAVRAETSTIPIVMIGVSNPVDVGFIANLARPGGNITGVSNLASDLSAKQVEMLREIVPDAKHIGVIANAINPGSTLQIAGTEAAIRALGLRVTRGDANNLDAFQREFRRLKAEGVSGVVLLADPSLIEHGTKIADLAKVVGLPAVFQRRENVEMGGLLSYGPNLPGQFRQTANYVDRILKGANPAELPVEQPTTFELVINLRTAKALGITIPATMLGRADEVIE